MAQWYTTLYCCYSPKETRNKSPFLASHHICWLFLFCCRFHLFFLVSQFFPSRKTVQKGLNNKKGSTILLCKPIFPPTIAPFVTTTDGRSQWWRVLVGWGLVAASETTRTTRSHLWASQPCPGSGVAAEFGVSAEKHYRRKAPRKAVWRHGMPIPKIKERVGRRRRRRHCADVMCSVGPNGRARW